MKRILSLVLAVALCMSIVTITATASADEEKVVTVANTAAWESLTPMTSNRDQQVAWMYPIYESWFTLTNEGEVLPRLMESWELDPEDSHTLICHMNQAATWSDGEKITADDIIFTLDLESDPNLNCTQRYVVGNFIGTNALGVREDESAEKGWKKIDDYTVSLTFKTEKAAGTVLSEVYAMRYTFTLPKHCLENIPVESVLTDSFWENPVTSGAFTVAGIISGERIEYVARDDYYLGRPQMDRLIMRVITADNMLSAFMAGEIDTSVYGSSISYGDYELATQMPSLVCTQANGFANAHILINNQVLDKYVRLAMDCAINKQSIIDDCIYGYARPAISAIVPENPYRNQNVTGNAYDVEQAKAYLAQSSYDTTRPIKLMVTSTSTLNQQIAVLVQQNLAAIGLTVSIETYDGTTVSSKLFAGDYDISIMGSASNPFEPSESRFYFQVGSTGWLNMPDDTWEQIYDAAIDGDFEQRKAGYDILQEKLVEEVPMIFLYHADVLFVSSDRVSNLPYASFSLKSWQYETWEVK